MDYGPALPPHLRSDLHNASDQNSNASEEPSKKASDRPKKHSHSRHDVESRSALDQYNYESDVPRMSSTKPKNMLIRVNIRSGPLSDQDQPQHDPDPPYYREVALTFPPSMLKRWTPSGAFFASLTPGSLCLGPQLQLWVWMIIKTVKSSDLEVLPLCYRSAQLSKMPLISLNMIFSS